MRRAASRSLSIAIATLLTCAVGASAADKPAPVLIGFDAAGSSAQRALETRFDAQLKADDQRDWLHDMASEPNHVGSPHDKANAEYTLAKFKEWGWDAQIETFDVLYPTPKSESLELVAPTAFKAKLHEPPIDGDPASAHFDAALPPYNVFGADGDVTAAQNRGKRANKQGSGPVTGSGAGAGGVQGPGRSGTSGSQVGPALK